MSLAKGTIEGVPACPFCGGEVDPTGWLRGDGVRGPECNDCGATAPSMEVWQRRAHLAPLQTENAQLRILSADQALNLKRVKRDYVELKAERDQLKARCAELEPLSGSIKECRSCGSTSLTWETHNKNTSGVAEGRLRSGEVRCFLVLGCDSCSETLAVVSADEFAGRLNAALSSPVASEPV